MRWSPSVCVCVCVCPGARVGSPRPVYLFFYLNEMTRSPPAWFEKKKIIFDRGQPSFVSWKSSFCVEAKLQAHRFSEFKRPVFLDCIASLV